MFYRNGEKYETQKFTGEWEGLRKLKCFITIFLLELNIMPNYISNKKHIQNCEELGWTFATVYLDP